MKKVLVTGASGFVGSRFVKAMQGRYELLTPTHKEFDITNSASIEKFIAGHAPQIILHLAAISNTGYCEEHPEESYLVNVQGVENVAAACERHNAKFIFFSSDQVYNGCREKGLLDEQTPLAPENHYGCHKLMAEERACKLCGNSVALRATWMYDTSHEEMSTHPNFVTNIKNAIEQKNIMKFATREYRGITWVREVLENLPHAFELPAGVYNFGAENILNTYETACAYCSMLGHNPDGIVAADTARYLVHERNISISLAKISKLSDGAVKFSNTLEGLRRFLSA